MVTGWTILKTRSSWDACSCTNAAVWGVCVCGEMEITVWLPIVFPHCMIALWPFLSLTHAALSGLCGQSWPRPLLRLCLTGLSSLPLPSQSQARASQHWPSQRTAAKHTQTRENFVVDGPCVCATYIQASNPHFISIIHIHKPHINTLLQPRRERKCGTGVKEDWRRTVYGKG